MLANAPAAQQVLMIVACWIFHENAIASNMSGHLLPHK
jgi:hypothetical protein